MCDPKGLQEYREVLHGEEEDKKTTSDRTETQRKEIKLPWI